MSKKRRNHSGSENPDTSTWCSDEKCPKCDYQHLCKPEELASSTIPRRSGTVHQFSPIPVAPKPAPDPTHLLVSTINGDVQGRSCRFSTQTLAESLGVTGIAINRPDGSVEVRAWGNPDMLRTFRDGLQYVPSGNTNFVQSLPVIPAPATMETPLVFDYK